MRKCCLPAFSHCPTMFSKAFLNSVLKISNCVVIAEMTLGAFSLIEIYDRTADSAEQDQTAGMCRLILFYTLRGKKMAVNG